ncbi:DUF4159 domain-containing protein [Poriferisphaera corsica]|uniref:DUF4159 domain-containing protein n=1 Tax=Poriferisphaera corsica TaxID=2528020 RepID=UPI00190CBB98|nr:DUF4159 domain-containing protein [Poriferisphaera corsica]
MTDEHVQAAIERIQNYLFSTQNADGNWEGRYSSPKYVGGETAIVTYALITSGISPQDPRLEKTIKYLINCEMNGTYAVSLRAHCLAAMSSQFAGKLSVDARWLAQNQDGGRYTYAQPSNSFDHSNTQYGILGLWECAKRSISVGSNVWPSVIDHFQSSQNDDGGWGYTPKRQSDVAMAAAGVTSLLIAQEMLYRGRDTANEKLQDAISRGLVYLDVMARKHNGVVGVSKMYDMYGVERVALASGAKMFGGRDWFEAGSEYILKKMSRDGSFSNSQGWAGGSNVNTSFALLYLSRGRVPVWINKIQLNDIKWNNRPNDINLLTRRLSARREQEQNWQVINIASDPFYWLNAPIAWISAREEFSAQKLELENLRTYIQMGGLLIINPENNSREFSESMRLTLSKLFPRAKWIDMPSTHPMLNLIHEIKIPSSKPIRILTNGVRDLAITLPRDWGYVLQTGKSAFNYQPDLAMFNLYAMVSDRGRLSHRLTMPMISKKNTASTSEITVIRARYSGSWGQEPLWLHAIASLLHNNAGINLQRANVPLDKIASYPNAFVHLSGNEAISLSGDQLNAISSFTEQGGTILVETIGGLGDFSISIQEQLTQSLQKPSVRIPDTSPILDGKAIGGYSLVRPKYRNYTTEFIGIKNQSRLEAIYINDRPAIIFTHEDITLGALGMKRWGVNGYEISDARKLWSNMLLYYKQSLDPNAKTIVPTKSIMPDGISTLLQEQTQ